MPGISHGLETVTGDLLLPALAKNLDHFFSVIAEVAPILLIAVCFHARQWPTGSPVSSPEHAREHARRTGKAVDM